VFYDLQHMLGIPVYSYPHELCVSHSGHGFEGHVSAGL